MSENIIESVSPGNELKRTIKFILQEMKPRGKWLTPFNIISIPIIIMGIIILVIRFTQGLGAVTNLSQEFPWGLWKGLNVVTGVAFAAGAYIITFVVYVMGIDKYHSIVRATVLNGLLAYIFYAGALIFELGNPWNIFNPIIGNSFGYNSVLFLVSWHFLLYILAQILEFSPVVAEWLGWERVRKFLKTLTIGAVIFGITLSLLHQSGLGALFMMAKSKIHPLWYTEFIPILFVISSVPAGLSMIIFEGSISRNVFKDQINPKESGSFDEIIYGLAQGASISLLVYFVFKGIVAIHDHHENLITNFDFWTLWYFIEIIGFVLVPCIMFADGVKYRSIFIIRVAAIMTMIGIILNRLNISIIAFNWQAPVRYYPTWMEIVVTLMIIFVEIWVFRWVVTRMPVFSGTHD